MFAPTLLLRYGEKEVAPGAGAIIARGRSADPTNEAPVPILAIDQKDRLSMTLLPLGNGCSTVITFLESPARFQIHWGLSAAEAVPSIGVTAVAGNCFVSLSRAGTPVGMLMRNNGRIIGAAASEVSKRGIRAANPNPLELAAEAEDCIVGPEDITGPALVDSAAGLALESGGEMLSDASDDSLELSFGSASARVALQSTGTLSVESKGLYAIRDADGVRVYLYGTEPDRPTKPALWASFRSLDQQAARLQVFGSSLRKRADISVLESGLLLTSANGVMKSLN